MTKADPDTVNLKEALNEPDAHKFLEAMVKEVDDHVECKHWRLVTDEEMRRSGCKDRPIVAVWSMRRKRSPLGQITKCKARLCTHGGMTLTGIHCNNTHAPVITWTMI